MRFILYTFELFFGNIPFEVDLTKYFNSRLASQGFLVLYPPTIICSLLLHFIPKLFIHTYICMASVHNCIV